MSGLQTQINLSITLSNSCCKPPSVAFNKPTFENRGNDINKCSVKTGLKCC